MKALSKEWAESKLPNEDGQEIGAGCPASDLFGHWAPKAYAALKGAEVLARCLAETKVALGEAIDAEHFLGNNDNFAAIMDALRDWPND